MIFSILSIVAEDIVSTNGVFYTDQNVECVLISQSGSVGTNKLEAAKTYQVGNLILEFSIQTPTIFRFSGGPLLKAGTNSSFSILSFGQEVYDLDSTPRVAKFGSHVLSIMLSKGEFGIIYPNTNQLSVVNISTHYANYEINKGKYYFKLTGKSALGYVIDGQLLVSSESEDKLIEKGHISLAVPFGDEDSGITAKMITSYKKASAEEMDKFISPVLELDKIYGDVLFVIVSSRIVGVALK